MARQQHVALLFAVTLGFSVSSCATLRVARDPMPTVVHEGPAEAPPTRAVILLPGLGDRPNDFERNGFVEMLHEVDPTALVFSPDAHFGYYRNRTAMERLRVDVLEPAIASGADEIWVVGISMGGAGALGLAEAYAEDIDGLILLAPYLGGRGISEEVEAAGGLVEWEQHSDPEDGDRRAFFRDIWAWLDGYTTGEERPEIRLGAGESDRGIRGISLVGEALPSASYVTVDGGHDWRAWRPLFDGFVGDAFAESAAAKR